MPGVGSTAYPTIETWANLVRVHVNDTFKGATSTPGEGRIFTDGAPFTIPILNDCLADYQRELDNASIPTKYNEVFFTQALGSAIPPINSNLGAGNPNASAQQELSFTGFFDGYINYAAPSLPVDCLVPKRMWYRQAGSNLTFTEFFPARAGLQSQFQDYAPGEWDWRGYSIFWNGSLVQTEMRMRYVQQVAFYGNLSTPLFSSTTIPFKDSISVLALMGAEKFCASRLPGGATASLQAKIRSEMDKNINREVKAMQATRHGRGAYGETGDIFTF
jgi:hypothetical protein